MGEPAPRDILVMNKISHALKIFLSVVFLHGLAGLPALANDSGPWKVARVAGDALIQKSGSDWQKLAMGEMVSVGHRLRTGRSGELILTRDDERVTMTPNSVLEVQPGGSNLATRLYQKAGTMMFKVRKKARKHFEVRTPYLVAVVKGTQFTVSVHEQGGAVHVTEGLVEVADVGAQNKIMVHPGKTASVAATKGSKVQLGVTPPAARKKRSGEQSKGDRAPGKQSRAPKLMQPIGIAKVNISKRSKGLLKRRGNLTENQTASRVPGKSGISAKSNSANGNAFGNPFDKTAGKGLGNAFGHSNGNNAGGNGNGNGGGNGNGNGNGNGGGAGGGHGNGNGNNGNGNGNNGNGNGNGNNGNGNGNGKK